MRDTSAHYMPITDVKASEESRILHMTIAHNETVTKDSDFWLRIVDATPQMKSKDRSPWLQKLCDVGQSTVSRWKSGTNYPTLENALLISGATGYCVQYLLNGGGPQLVGDPDELLDMLAKLSSEDRAEVLRFAMFRALD